MRSEQKNNTNKKRNIYLGMHILTSCTIENSTSFLFSGGEPEHNCRLPQNVSREEGIPKKYKNGDWEWDACHQYVNFSSATNVTERCTAGWEYDASVGPTIVTEVCDR